MDKRNVNFRFRLKLTLFACRCHSASGCPFSQNNYGHFCLRFLPEELQNSDPPTLDKGLQGTEAAEHYFECRSFKRRIVQLSFLVLKQPQTQAFCFHVELGRFQLLSSSSLRRKLRIPEESGRTFRRWFGLGPSFQDGDWFVA